MSDFFEAYLIFIKTHVHSDTKPDMWGIFWSIKFDHFKVPLVLKMNRHFCFAMGFYARVYGTYRIDVNHLVLTPSLFAYVLQRF